ncbi:MAG: NTP transferase domain-containing protein [Terriglobia bacterium]
MERIAGIILAAGESARMGQDKALLTLSSAEGWGATTFLEHLLRQVKDSNVGLVRVVLGANADAVQKKIPFGAAEVVVNPNWQQGQLSSLIAALDSLPRGMTEAALVCLVDHPAISSALIRTLIDNFQQSGKLIIIPTFGGRRGHPVIFSAKLFDELRRAPRDVGARAVVRNHPGDILEVPTEEEGVVLNINDPEAYEKIRKMHPPA